jgi:twitching motility protein PilT
MLKSTPRTREYIKEGESNGKSLIDAMRDGKHDGMQDFDFEIESLIQRKIVTTEDGLAFATNPNNLLLSLKGMSATDDFMFGNAAAAPSPANSSNGANGSLLNMIE